MEKIQQIPRSIWALGFLTLIVACSSSNPITGIATLGNGFVNAFNQGPNDTPVDPDTITLSLTPNVEPFDP